MERSFFGRPKERVLPGFETIDLLSSRRLSSLAP